LVVFTVMPNEVGLFGSGETLFSVPVFTKLLVPVLLYQPPQRTSAVPLFCNLAPLK
jgi:hypothetical protein